MPYLRRVHPGRIYTVAYKTTTTAASATKRRGLFQVGARLVLKMEVRYKVRRRARQVQTPHHQAGCAAMRAQAAHASLHGAPQARHKGNGGVFFWPVSTILHLLIAAIYFHPNH
jgi:hypothetical protein